MAELWHKTCWKQPNLPIFAIFIFNRFWFSKSVFGSFFVFFAKSWLKNMYCSATSLIFLRGWPFLSDDLGWPWPVLCSSWMLKTAWDGHREPTYQISIHSYNGAERNRNLYTNSLRAYTISQCVAVLRLRFFQKLNRLRHSFLRIQWRCYDAHLVLISSILEQAKVFKT